MPDPKKRQVIGVRDDGTPVYEGESWDVATPRADKPFRSLFGNVGMGAVKGGVHTAATIADLLHSIPGVSSAMDATGATEPAIHEVQQWASPSGLAEGLGYGVEQIAEMLVPARLAAKGITTVAGMVPRLARPAVEITGGAATGAALAAAQGGDPRVGAALGAAGSVASEAIPVVQRWAGNAAVRAGTAGLKPPVTILKKEAGASREGISAVSKRVVKFILDNELTTPEKAEALIKAAEQDYTSVLAAADAVTDAGDRTLRYLQSLLRQTKKGIIPTDQRQGVERAIRNFMRESPFTESVPVVDALGHPVLDSNGNPLMRRVTRQDVMASEAMDAARETSSGATRNQWGERKSTPTEAQKAAERAARDAAKAAVPEIREPLARERQGIRAKELLNRYMQRTSNRDVVGLPTWVTTAPSAASAIASGNAGKLAASAFMGAVSHALRSGQLQAGIHLNRLSNALAAKDAAATWNTLSLIAAAEASPAMPAHEPVAPVASHVQTAPVVPDDIRGALQGQKAGYYTKDGVTWQVAADGSVRKVR